MNQYFNTSGFIFDMDGVIFDSESTGAKELQRHARSVGLEIPRESIKKYRGQTGIKIWLGIMEEFNLPRDLDYYLQSFDPQGFKAYQGIPPTKGLPEFLKMLRVNNIPTAVATSARQDRMDAVLQFLNLTEFFNAKISGSDVKNSKPHPEIFLKAAQIINKKPADCVVFEDAPNGIQAALSGGFTCIGIKNTENTVDDLKAAHGILEDFSDQSLELLDKLLKNSD
jgi:HAD superfamily hydrolase (TIGR01509 family)